MEIMVFVCEQCGSRSTYLHVVMPPADYVRGITCPGCEQDVVVSVRSAVIAAGDLRYLRRFAKNDDKWTITNVTDFAWYEAD